MLSSFRIFFLVVLHSVLELRQLNQSFQSRLNFLSNEIRISVFFDELLKNFVNILLSIELRSSFEVYWIHILRVQSSTISTRRTIRQLQEFLEFHVIVTSWHSRLSRQSIDDEYLRSISRQSSIKINEVEVYFYSSLFNSTIQITTLQRHLIRILLIFESFQQLKKFLMTIWIRIYNLTILTI